MQASTVPPLAHEIACSGPRPPNTTATRILRFWLTLAPLCSRSSICSCHASGFVVGDRRGGEARRRRVLPELATPGGFRGVVPPGRHGRRAGGVFPPSRREAGAGGSGGSPPGMYSGGSSPRANTVQGLVHVCDQVLGVL